MADNLYWGDTHPNTHQFGAQDPPLTEYLDLAAAHLDFLTTAYYTACSDEYRPLPGSNMKL